MIEIVSRRPLERSGLSAINCTGGEPADQRVTAFISQSMSDNTRRGYALDLTQFKNCGGSIPASPEVVARYLADGAETYAVATLERRLAAISKVHRALGVADPTKAAIVAATMQGIRRSLGASQKQARALLRDDLFAVLDRLGNRPKDVRDRAMLLIGFALAARRSELVALDVEDVEYTAKGALITIRKSKTDQEMRGRKVAVPFGRTRHCPIAALKGWLAFAGIETGAIFLALNKHGDILPRRISSEAVRQTLKTRLSAVGYDPAPYSAHSLRSGLVTSAAMAGASSYKIRQVTGHRTEAGLAPYLRAVDLFEDAAAARVL
jgi:integrase